MMQRSRKSGIAVALAWPETWCKQAGAWYEPITKWAGFNVNHYYQAGHAALVLIDVENQVCHYFDFGRYHAPFQHGRVRGVITDHELRVFTKPKISVDGRILENFDELLSELQNNSACHGQGTLHASYITVDFENAYQKALQMQQTGPVPYGPFRYKGSNCSRFVNTVIRSGKPDLWAGFKLSFFVPLTPTPMNNVNALKHKESVAPHPGLIPFDPLQQMVKPYLRNTLPPPPKHADVPDEAVWLSGEGAGSWFSLEHCSERVISARYSPDGRLECIGMFENKGYHSDIPNNYTLTHPSDCRTITLQSGNKTIKMRRIPDKELICHGSKSI